MQSPLPRLTIKSCNEIIMANGDRASCMPLVEMGWPVRYHALWIEDSLESGYVPPVTDFASHSPLEEPPGSYPLPLATTPNKIRTERLPQSAAIRSELLLFSVGASISPGLHSHYSHSPPGILSFASCKFLLDLSFLI